MKRARPTINDVARKAGVSKATVSGVINNTGSVKDSTRSRVLEAIEDLNYRPSGLAKRTGDPPGRCIGLLIKEIDNPYYSEIIAGAREEANAHGYTLLVASSEGDYPAERRIVQLLDAKDIDGLVITPVFDRNADLSHLFELKRRNFPFVLLEEIRGVQASLVDIDNVEATCRLVKYLIDEGHSRIVHFVGPSYSMHSEHRLAGVRKAYSESHLIFTPELMVPAGAHAEDGYRAGLEYFRGKEKAEWPTVVTCYNDLVAFGLLRALAETGIRVPEDVSVVGYDDIALLGYLPVPLTTVHIPKREMGQHATQLLIRHIESSEIVPPQKVMLEAELVIRSSTRSLRKEAGARPVDRHLLEVTEEVGGPDLPQRR